MAKTSRRLLAKAIVRLLQEQPKNNKTIARSLAAYLVMYKMTHHFDALIKDMQRELQAKDGVLYADVESAFDLNVATRNELVAYLRASTDSRFVELSEYTNPDLLSGVIVRTADQELDMTARRQLKQLASLTTGGK